MRGIDGLDRLQVCAEQSADDFAEAVAAVAHGQQLQLILRTRTGPAAPDGFGSNLGGEGSLELVRRDDDFHGQTYPSGTTNSQAFS